MKRPLLLVLSRFPYPPIGGDKLKNYHLIKILSKHFDIHAVCLSQNPLGTDELAFCEQYFTQYKIFYKSKLAHLLATLRALVSPLPIQAHYYYFKDIQAYINSHSQKCAILFNTLIRTAPYIQPLEGKAIKVLDMVDSISLNYKHSKHKTTSLFHRIFYTLEGKRLEKYEQTCVRTYDLSLFVNHLEAKTYEPYGAVKCLPNGVDSALLVPREPLSAYRHCVAFCGKMDYQPNIDAMLWFIDLVLPKLHPDITLLIMGANPTKELLAKASSRIRITGYLEDIHTPNASCLATIAPMQTGGGIQNKILEAMALGQVVITTTLGAQPIAHAQDKIHLLVYDDPEAMAQEINALFANPDSYAHIRHNAQALIREHYSWDGYEQSLLHSLNALLESYGGGARLKFYIFCLTLLFKTPLKTSFFQVPHFHSSLKPHFTPQRQENVA